MQLQLNLFIFLNGNGDICKLKMKLEKIEGKVITREGIREQKNIYVFVDDDDDDDDDGHIDVMKPD